MSERGDAETVLIYRKGMSFGRMVGVCLLALSMNLVSCGGAKTALEDGQRVREAVKTELGIDAHVASRTTNGHTTVTVSLAAPPAGDAAEAKRKITDIVNRSFRTKVEAVHLSF